MSEQEKKKRLLTTDQLLTILFAALSIIFVMLMALNPAFFEWAFSRHQNILSWYIRPLFLIPICYFAFKRQAAGISITIFLLGTSMFWFPQPEMIDPSVQEFLAMERDYLTGYWTAQKLAITAIVPISMGLLIWVFWKRNIKAGIAVIVGIALGKILWSVVEGGAAGVKVIVPALFGLGLCVVAIIWWYKRSNKGKS